MEYFLRKCPVLVIGMHFTIESIVIDFSKFSHVSMDP
jgi:hypothetical protein